MWLRLWWRRRWGSTAFVPPPVSPKVPSPTRLVVLEFSNTLLEVVTPTRTRLDVIEPINTRLLWLSDEGLEMAQPLYITAGETGPLVLACIGGDQTRQNLAGATCTLRVVNVDGTVVVDNVSVPVTDSDGEVTWTRTALQVATPGDYRYQVKAVLPDTTTVYFPDSDPNIGNALTMLRTV